MPSINRVRVALTGFAGSPGVSTFYCLNPVTFLPLLRAFYLEISPYVPNTVGITVEAVGDIIDSTSGLLTGSWSAAAPAIVPGQIAGAYAAPSGAAVSWLTGTILDGHRLRGRTFLVPLAGSAYDDDGSLLTAALLNFRANAETLVNDAAANFVVWHRPREASAPGVTPVVLARAGGHAVVTGSFVNDRVAILRSRRD